MTSIEPPILADLRAAMSAGLGFGFIATSYNPVDTAGFDFGSPQQADEHGVMIGSRITLNEAPWRTLRRAILRH